jgi:hypothetical protein
MNAEELGHIDTLQDLVEIGNNEAVDNDDDWEMLDGVLRGSTALAISSHGGELKEVLERLSAECERVKQ